MKLIIDIPEKEYKECIQRCEWDTLTLGVKLIHFVQDGIPLEDIKAEIVDIEEPDHDFEGFYYCLNEVMKIIDKHIKENKQ